MRETNIPSEVNTSKCKGCGSCVKACPVFTLGMKDGKAFVEHKDLCIECGQCGAVCPEGAVSHQRAKVTAELKPGKKPAVSPEDCLQLLRERRSVRVYRKEPIPKDVLEKIINAGRYAPTGSNSQRVRYIVLTSQDEIAELGRMVIEYNAKFFKLMKNKAFAGMMSTFMGRKKIHELSLYGPTILHAQKQFKQGNDRIVHNAAAIVLVHTETWDGSPAFNCAAALYHCSLMAHTLGVGVCFNGFLENTVNINRKIKKSLDIPGDHKCFGAMTMGYQDIEYKRLIERKEATVRWR